MKLAALSLLALAAAHSSPEWHARPEHMRARGMFGGPSVLTGHWEPNADRRNEQDLENEKFPITHKNLHYDGPIVKHERVRVEGFGEHKWACKNGARYVTYEQLCDGRDDCGDNSDEGKQCVNGKPSKKAWDGETARKWNINQFTPPIKTQYNRASSQKCCVAQCDSMTSVISSATLQNIADCKMGCGLWLGSSSLNYESKTWWPQLQHKCKSQCGAAQFYKDFRDKCVGNKKSPLCKIDLSYWEYHKLTPATIEMCENGCESYMGCMNKLETE